MNELFYKKKYFKSLKHNYRLDRKKALESIDKSYNNKLCNCSHVVKVKLNEERTPLDLNIITSYCYMCDNIIYSLVRSNNSILNLDDLFVKCNIYDIKSKIRVINNLINYILKNYSCNSEEDIYYILSVLIIDIYNNIGNITKEEDILRIIKNEKKLELL